MTRATLIGVPVWRATSSGPTEMAHPAEWTKEALCATHPNPDLWFSTDPRGKRAAKDICARCPVREICLAQSGMEEYGIWGGVERRPECKRPCANGLHERIGGPEGNIRPIIIDGKVSYGCLDCEAEGITDGSSFAA